MAQAAPVSCRGIPPLVRCVSSPDIDQLVYEAIDPGFLGSPPWHGRMDTQSRLRSRCYLLRPASTEQGNPPDESGSGC
jgi:hypothetical protein